MFLHKLKLIKIAAIFSFAILVSFTMQACADQLFPEFTVDNSYLENGKAIVVFSADVNPASAKKSFLFAEDEKEIEGSFCFDGNKIVFAPKETIGELKAT